MRLSNGTFRALAICWRKAKGVLLHAQIAAVPDGSTLTTQEWGSM